MQFNKIFYKVYNKQDLSSSEAIQAFNYIMSGKISNILISAFLVSLSLKGISDNELLAAVKVLRSKSLKIKSIGNIVDTCGTGGDNKNTLNISTATAILAAASGVKVAKHGNKSVSSKSGSSDVLEKLGINLNASLKKVEKSLNSINICFLMAPLYHKAMKNVADVRSELKIPTLFNILGPLLNPANASTQLIGVYKKKWLLPIANCLVALKVKKAWVVHGQDGLDEITTTTNTDAIEVNNNKIRKFTINPQKLGIKKTKLNQLKGKDPKYNATQIINLFTNNNKNKSYEDIVVLNTAAVLFISGKCTNIRKGIELARENINNGNAFKKLKELKNMSN